MDWLMSHGLAGESRQSEPNSQTSDQENSQFSSQGNYGRSGMQLFKEFARDAGICEATATNVANTDGDEEYDHVIETLRGHGARVVVCFCEGMTVRRLIKAAARRNAHGYFLFIGSDGWAVRPDVVEGIENDAVGGMSIKLYSPQIRDFDQHYFSLSPFNNSRNPWFKEFWQEKFRCYIPGEDQDSRFTTPCTGEESLRKDYVQDAKLGFVVNAIYTMAYALDAMHRDICGRRADCPVLRPVNGSIFMQYLLNVSFTTYSNDWIEFNANGDPPGRYDIMNYQKLETDNGTEYFDYVQIGSWDTGNLTMDNNRIFWPNKDSHPGAPMVESVCSQPCPKGQVKKVFTVRCCWSCSPCGENEILLDETTCKACPQGWWPNEDLNACIMLEIRHIQWGDTEAVVAMVFACVGIIVTILVTAVFVKHNNTAVVKASTRELSYIILFGVGLSYLTTFPVVAKPSLVTCYLARILPGLSFSLMYGALVTKTNRIARILAGSKKKIMTRKPRFMSACAQVVITCIIIGIECAIITVMLILEPADSKLVYPTKTTVRLTCNATTMGIIVPLGFDIFLILMCTLYAIKTRNLPENFNEAKFQGFTMYTTCIIWLAFVPIYFGSDNKVITMCLAITMSATVALVLLFFPKLYIILCKPERNNRSAFTTSKDVRCHIGSTGARSYNNSNESMDRTGYLHPRNIWYCKKGLREVSVEYQRRSETRLIGCRDDQSEPCDYQEDQSDAADKNFPNTAMSIYRQKNFFERWKNRSIQRKPSSSHFNTRSSGGYRHSHQNSIHVHIPDKHRPIGGSSREVFALKENNSSFASSSQRSGSRGGGDRRDDVRETDLGQGHSSVSFQSTASVLEPSSRYTDCVDSGVQTDEELLQNFLPSLRRRRVEKSDSSGSNKSNAEGVSPTVKTRRTSRGSASSNRSNEIRDDISTFYNASPSKLDYDASETDLLLSNEHKSDTLDRNLLGIGEQSPLLASAEQSPLLSADERFACDSTSEETLSDREHSLEDIEDLLTGACPYDGSFGSLCVTDLEPPISPTQISSLGREPHRWRHPKSNLRTHTVQIQSRALHQNSPSPPDSRTSKESLPYTKDRSPVVVYVPAFSQDAPSSDSPLRAARSAPVLVSSPTTPPVGQSPCRLSPSAAKNNNHVTVGAGDMLPQICVHQATPNPSIPSTPSDRSVDNNGCGATSGVSHERPTRMVSMEDLGSVPRRRGNLPESDSVTKFQEYLRTRGLELDLSSVQSSDV